MGKCLCAALISLHCLTIWGILFSKPASAELELSPKISPTLKSKLLLKDQQVKEVIVEFKDEENSKSLHTFDKQGGMQRANATRGQLLSELGDAISGIAATAQLAVKDFLDLLGIPYKSYWISNVIYIPSIDRTGIIKISEFPGVIRIRPACIIRIPKPIDPDPEEPPPSGQDVPQPIQQIRARCDDIKCLGNWTVTMIVAAGVNYTHENLIDNWRKKFGWVDPIDNTLKPFDFDNINGHGTVAAGIAAGKYTGVAPHAQWVAGRIPSDTTEWVVYEVAQWAICPYDSVNKDKKDCSKAPHVINNSWVAHPTEYVANNFYYNTLQWLIKAGIISVFSGGNEGPYCTSVLPPAMYDIALSVGAVSNRSIVAWWSSRGPCLNEQFDSGTDHGAVAGVCMKHCQDPILGGGGKKVCLSIKPDIAAPGVLINSSGIPNKNSYVQLSGTSFAAPAVSGVVALMFCANNGTMKMNQTVVDRILKGTAMKNESLLEEGDARPDRPHPNNYAKISHLLCDIAYGICEKSPNNNLYGHGVVDACAAVKETKKEANAKPADQRQPSL